MSTLLFILKEEVVPMVWPMSYQVPSLERPLGTCAVSFESASKLNTLLCASPKGKVEETPSSIVKLLWEQGLPSHSSVPSHSADMGCGGSSSVFSLLLTRSLFGWGLSLGPYTLASKLLLSHTAGPKGTFLTGQRKFLFLSGMVTYTCDHWEAGARELSQVWGHPGLHSEL